jgi:hypothetical protein
MGGRYQNRISHEPTGSAFGRPDDRLRDMRAMLGGTEYRHAASKTRVNALMAHPGYTRLGHQ